MDVWAAAELQATCANLGTFDGVKYLPDSDCVECVKDLIRFLRRDDENHEVRRAIGDLGVVKSDMVYILRDHSSNRELFDVALRLVVNLTNPELLLFKEELPEDKETRNYYLQIQTHRQGYKQAFVDKDLWKVLADKLRSLLNKDFDERLEDDKLIMERILILVRNVLQVPTNVRSEQRTDGDADLHDQILWVLNQAGMEDLLLYIASSESEIHYCLHVLEIISLMLREQDPAALASASLARSAEEKKGDEEALREAKRVEDEIKRQKSRKIISTRHNRFGGTFVVKNLKGVSDKDIIVHKPIHDIQSLDFDKSKRGLKKAKNRRTPDCSSLTRRSTLAVRIFMKEFCNEFLLSAYNQLMSVVKDSLNRQRAQMNDETYYLWSIKFFMEFNRNNLFKIEYVSETMSRQTFHFLQQQIENYRDNFEFEKRNRPKYLMWARRMHLGIRAYQELLLNLVQMESSPDTAVKESGRAIRASVFYEPEYRELCLQQLSSFNPDRMSRGYLTDLVHTTHVFIKLMEHMSKNKHLLVSKKTKKKATQKKKTTGPGPGEVSETQQARETKEDQWDAVSSELTALLQGKGVLPTDIVPYDSVSDVPMDEQKVTAMKKIQQELRTKQAANALARLRAAREIWPEGEAFGAADAGSEDDFMALREILMADLGEDEEQGGADNTVGNEEGEVGEEGEGDEEEEEQEQRIYSVEQEFDFKSFVARFAVKAVVMPFGLLFSHYSQNSKNTNHYIIKMFHRIAVDCATPGILFQASVFRVFQRIWQDLKAKPHDANLRELAKFAKFILGHFLTVAKTNKKVFMELLIWKTSRDAIEIVEGYGTQSSTARSKKVYWSEEQEDRLRTVFSQVKEMEASNPEADILDQIVALFEHENRTRRQVGNKLRELGVINSMREITRKPLTSKREWTEEEVNKLTELYREYQDAEHPANRIHEQWKMSGLTSRSKGKLVEKIMTLGLCHDRSRLGKIKRRRGSKNKDERMGGARSDSDSALDSSSGEEETDSQGEEEEEQGGSGGRRKGMLEACKEWLAQQGTASATVEAPVTASWDSTKSSVEDVARSADGDASTTADGDAPTTADGDAPTTADGDAPTTADGDAPTTADGDTPTTADEDTPTTADVDVSTTADVDVPSTVEDSISKTVEGDSGSRVTAGPVPAGAHPLGGEALAWVSRVLLEEADDRAEADDADDDNEDLPLVPLEESLAEAVNTSAAFQAVLEGCGLTRPMAGEQYWRIPGDLSAATLRARGTVLGRMARGVLAEEQVLAGVERELLVVARGLAGIHHDRKKKKKRGPNKWMPFRREAVPAAATSTPAHTPSAKAKKSRKTARQSFLQSDSDDSGAEADKPPASSKLKVPPAAGWENDNGGSGRIVSAEFVEDSDSSEDDGGEKKKKKAAAGPLKSGGGGRRDRIDREKLLKLLNDDNDSDLSSDTEEETADKAAGAHQESGEEEKKRSTATKGKAKSAATRGKKSADSDAGEATGGKRQGGGGNRKAGTVSRGRGGKSKAAPDSEKEKPVARSNKAKNKRASIMSDSDGDEKEDAPSVPTSPVFKKKGRKSLESDDDEEIVGKNKDKKEEEEEDESDNGGKRENSGKKGRRVNRFLDSSDDDESEKENGEDDRDGNPSGDVLLLRSRSSSLDDSRISRRSLSPLDDSRLDDSRRRSPSVDSRLDDSRLMDDSRLSRRRSPSVDSRLADDSRVLSRSSSIDSRVRSSRSSSRSSLRSSSRSVSPLSSRPSSRVQSPVSQRRTGASSAKSSPAASVRPLAARDLNAREASSAIKQAGKKRGVVDSPDVGSAKKRQRLDSGEDAGETAGAAAGGNKKSRKRLAVVSDSD